MTWKPELNRAKSPAAYAAEAAQDACDSARQYINFQTNFRSALACSHVARAALDELDAQLDLLIRTFECKEGEE